MSTRSDRRREAGARLLSRPILIDGDADELVTLLSQNAEASGITVVTYAGSLATKAPLAGVVMLGVEGHGRHSSITRAAQLLRQFEPVVAPDAVRLVVIQSGRSRVMPPKLQRRLADEILYQVAQVFPDLVPRTGWRSLKHRIGLALLDAAGLRILRFG